MWVRGLKHIVQRKKAGELCVAPYVGAWIETSKIEPNKRGVIVAPYVGAWIET